MRVYAPDEAVAYPEPQAPWEWERQTVISRRCAFIVTHLNAFVKRGNLASYLPKRSINSGKPHIRARSHSRKFMWIISAWYSR